MEKYVYTPLTESMVYFYHMFGDIGWSIIAVTLIVKILLLPLNIKASLGAEKTQRAMKKIKPEMDTIKVKHKGNKMAEAMAMQELYKKENFNPISGLGSILILLLQIPVIIGLYHVFNTRIDDSINHIAFNLFNIADKHIWMGILSGVSMYIMSKITFKNQNMLGDQSETQLAIANMMKIQITYIFPFVIGFSGAVLPSGIGIYFVVSNVFGILQYYVIEHFKKRLI